MKYTKWGSVCFVLHIPGSAISSLSVPSFLLNHSFCSRLRHAWQGRFIPGVSYFIQITFLCRY